MRILLTSMPARTGVWTHVRDLANQLAVRGHKVSVGLQVDPGLLSRRGIRKHHVPPMVRSFKRGIRVLLFERSPALIQFARRQRVELVHAHSQFAYPSSLRVAQALSLPLVITLHSVDRWEKKYPRTLALAERLIAIGPAQAQSAGDRCQKKLCIIPNGIDLQRFRPRTFALAPDAPLRVIWFGRSQGPTARGIQALNAAIHVLRAEGRAVEAWLIGPADVGLVHEFKRLGWVRDPRPFLQRGHVAFGHGRALREAMACGNLGFLLGAGFGGMITQTWFVRHGHQNTISAIPQYGFPPPDPAQLADALRQLDDDRASLQRLRQQAFQLARKYFDVRQMVDDTVAIYRACLPPEPQTTPALPSPA